MYLLKKSYLQLITIMLFMFFPMIVKSMNINESIFLKKDGSGSITLTYFAKETEIKAKNSLIGNFPFNKDKFTEYFKSAGTNLYSSVVEPNPKDNTSTLVTVVITFSDIANLSQMKAFSDVNVTVNETDSGKVIKSTYTPEFIKTNSLENLYIALKYDENIKSSNGNKNEPTSTIFFRGKEYIDGKTDISFWANIGGAAKKNEDVKPGDEKAKTCGLFGIELPFVFLLGSVLMYSNRKRKKQN